jgi:hypothetical protein
MQKKEMLRTSAVFVLYNKIANGRALELLA